MAGACGCRPTLGDDFGDDNGANAQRDARGAAREELRRFIAFYGTSQVAAPAIPGLRGAGAYQLNDRCRNEMLIPLAMPEASRHRADIHLVVFANAGAGCQQIGKIALLNGGSLREGTAGVGDR